MTLFEYLWVGEKVSSGSVRRAAIAVPTALCVLLVILLVGGPNAAGTAMTALFLVAVAGVALLPLLGLFWLFIWIVSCFADRS